MHRPFPKITSVGAILPTQRMVWYRSPYCFRHFLLLFRGLSSYTVKRAATFLDTHAHMSLGGYVL